MLSNTGISALSSTLNVLFFYLVLFKNEVYFWTTANVWMCTSAWHLLSLSEDVAAGRRLWQPLLGWDIRGLRSVPYCARCSTNHCQTSKQLPIWTNTHLDPLGMLSTSQAMEYHSTCIFYLLPDADYGNLAEKKLFRLSVQTDEGIIRHGDLPCIQKMGALLRSILTNC